MITTARQRVEEANALWNRANAQCRRLVDMMVLLDIEHPLYSEMLDELGAAEASRREAGTLGEIAMMDWFAETMAGINEMKTIGKILKGTLPQETQMKEMEKKP